MTDQPVDPPFFPEPGLRKQLLYLLDLREDQADPEVIDQNVRSGVVFRGTNLWLLLFAMIIASIGLNVNSTAVIIGAMLISPLMGPIIGAGYGTAIGDHRLLRRSIWNLAIAAGASVAVSAAYFSLSPLSTAHSELLARTTPTVWDVGIAFFGGLAGIVGMTRREKSNVLPGVAIATALMPPLCTAGYGVATLNLSFFLGAFYLFFINSVFIGAAAVAMSRLMHLPVAHHLDDAARRRALRWISVIVVGTALPSLYSANKLVRAEVFSARAHHFLTEAMPADEQRLVASSEVDAATQTIRVTVIGEALSPEAQALLTRSLPAYGLAGAKLVVNQSAQATLDIDDLRQDVTEDLYRSTLAMLEARSSRIAELEQRLARVETQGADNARITAELKSLLPEAEQVVVTSGTDGENASTVIALVQQKAALTKEDQQRTEAWLKQRTGATRAVLLAVPAF